MISHILYWYLAFSACFLTCIKCKLITQKEAINLMMNHLESNLTHQIKDLSNHITQVTFDHLPYNQTESVDSIKKKKHLLSNKLQTYLSKSLAQPALDGFRPILNNTINQGIHKFESSKSLYKRSLKMKALFAAKHIVVNISQKWDEHMALETQKWIQKRSKQT